MNASVDAAREECARCARPIALCYCAYLPSLPTRSRVLVLQHPRERPKAVGTARIAALCLPAAEVVVGVDFSEHARVRALLSDPARPAVLLYPGEGAKDLARHPPEAESTLVVIDGTWHQARAMVRKNPALRALPRYALSPQRPSEYRIRRAPQRDYISTIEAMAYALGVLEGDPARFQAMLEPFRAMVHWQLGFARVVANGRVRRVRRRAQRLTARVPDLFLAGRLVCVVGEANAWPYDRSARRPMHPHELIQWLAHRLDDEAGVDMVLAPRLPLASSPTAYSRLAADDLHRGVSPEQLLRAWRDFSRAEDVLCAWGTYGLNLMRREGQPLGERVLDLRKVVGDYLRRSPGSLEACVAELGLHFSPLGRGRGGERLGMLVAVAQWLRREIG